MTFDRHYLKWVIDHATHYVTVEPVYVTRMSITNARISFNKTTYMKTKMVLFDV